MNNSHLIHEIEQSVPSHTIMILHSSTIIVLTLLGNILLILAVLRSNRIKRRRRITPVQLLMLHMCTADISFALLTLFPNLLSTITSPIFHGPNSLCKFVKYIQVVPLYASPFLLVAISADRYYAICRPLDSMRMSAYNRPSIYAFIAWTIAFLLSTPQLFIFYKENNDCIPHYDENWKYVAYVCVFNTAVWLLPSVVAGSLYTCVCRAVWHSLAIRGTIKVKNKESDDLVQDYSLQVHHKGVRVRSTELDRRRIQTVKLTLTIVATNFILWAPFCLIQVIDAIWPSAISPIFATYILFFGNLNSCMNPWMWFIFNKDLLKGANPFYRLPSTKASRTEITLTERPVSRNS